MRGLREQVAEVAAEAEVANVLVALLARLSPVAAIPAALLFGALTSGSSAAQSAGIPVVVLQVIQAVILFSILGARYTITKFGKSGAKS